MTRQGEPHAREADSADGRKASIAHAGLTLLDADLEELAAMLRPLANLTRLRLLRFLTRPRYLEEIASHLGVTRQAARKHVDQLLAIGAIDKQPGRRPSGPVLEYVTNLQALFRIHDHFERLGALGAAPPAGARTQLGPARAARAAVGPGAALAIVRGMLAGQVFRLDPGTGPGWTLGRDPRCDLVVPYDPWVSNRHVDIRREGDAYQLLDLRSTNGTRHNWDPVPGGGSVDLAHGDIIEVGRTGLVFWRR